MYCTSVGVAVAAMARAFEFLFFSLVVPMVWSINWPDSATQYKGYIEVSENRNLFTAMTSLMLETILCIKRSKFIIKMFSLLLRNLLCLSFVKSMNIESFT